ncbi:MAG: response regulator transcription factor [Chitinophagaceae bacterium]|nr:response regulator transcription factor [Chitinophagaceae bacterium]
MIKAIIVDDEPRNNTILRKMLEGFCPDVTVVADATKAADVKQLLQTTDIDLLFLDIEMPGQNAFSLLDEIMPVKFNIIFVTAFDNYATKAFRYNAIDYLLKPVNIDELQLAIKKVSQTPDLDTINHQLQSLIQQLSRQQNPGKLVLQTQEGMFFFNYEEIVLCAAEGSYTRFDLLNGKSILVSGNLKKFEAMLPSAVFIRIHDSFLVNSTHIRKYNNGKGGYVELSNGKTAEVSVRRKSDFLSRFRI